MAVLHEFQANRSSAISQGIPLVMTIAMVAQNPPVGLIPELGSKLGENTRLTMQWAILTHNNHPRQQRANVHGVGCCHTISCFSITGSTIAHDGVIFSRKHVHYNLGLGTLILVYLSLAVVHCMSTVRFPLKFPANFQSLFCHKNSCASQQSDSQSQLIVSMVTTTSTPAA